MHAPCIGPVIFPEEEILPVHDLYLLDAAKGLLDPLVHLRLVPPVLLPLDQKALLVNFLEDQDQKPQQQADRNRDRLVLDEQIQDQRTDHETLRRQLHRRLDHAEEIRRILVDVPQQLRGALLDEVRIRPGQIRAHHPGGQRPHVGIDVAVLLPVHEDQVEILDHIDRNQQAHQHQNQLCRALQMEGLVEKGIDPSPLRQRVTVHDGIDERLHGRNPEELEHGSQDDERQKAQRLPLLSAAEYVIQFS